NTLRIGRHILEFLTGTYIKPEQLSDIEFSSFIQTEPYVSDFVLASENRSDVKAAKQALKVSKRAIVVEQSALWPVLSLEANRYTERDGFQSNIDWDSLLKFEIPIFNGGGTLGKIKSAFSNWKKAKLGYSLAKRQALLEIKEAYENLMAAQERFSALKESVDASQQNYELQKEEYSRNLVSNLDVLEALEEFHQASRQANQSFYEMKENYWRFQIALGELV
ncbi:MAG: TolC family protein, partial [Candidatus Omnitrophica bacterium]|nr:TolC family protein [Candidatus Omnitrophota bacterium]